MFRWFFLFMVILFSSCSTTYYVVRHAEKESAITMTSDVPLSAAGKERAEALKNKLRAQHIRQIFSTHTLRTTATAEPLSKALAVPINFYDTKDTLQGFISRLKNSRGNTLIVGHSNTVDDIVNQLYGATKITADLPDSAFGDLFIVKRRGQHCSFQKAHFGK